jgi:phosphopantothenoylcysteine decarboxylase/phosphopantothenate--cysteine ligase
MAHRVLLGVCGGISAYKTPDLVRQLMRAGHEVQVVMTRAAEAFVSELSLATVSARPVRRALFDPGAEVGAPGEAGVGHIELADWASAVLIAPATAHVLARAAHGLADDLLTTILLATRAPLLFAPAMNTNMWEHPATRANLELLRKRGARFVGPDSGELACGHDGAGRMSDAEVILEAVDRLPIQWHPGTRGEPVATPPTPPTPATQRTVAGGLQIEVAGSVGSVVDTVHSKLELRAETSKDSVDSADTAKAIAQLSEEAELSGLQPKAQPWAGRHVLVSAGPTRAYIDPVRFISNASTGSMGIELAKAARALGARVTIVTGPVELATPSDAQRVEVETGEQMLAAMDRVLSTERVDLVAMVAAVADLIPDRPSETKLAKDDMVDSIGQMKWRNEVDVLATLVEAHGSSTSFLGFAAQTVDSDVSTEIEAELLRYGGEKLDRKKTDALFVNRVGVQGTGFASSTNAGFLMIRRKPSSGHENSRAETDEMDEIINSGAPVAKAHLAHWILERLRERFFAEDAPAAEHGAARAPSKDDKALV